MTAYEMRISDWSSDVCSSDLSLKLKLASGREIAVVQIAGLVARRILCEDREGQQLKAGERFGLIRFGSRVDVYQIGRAACRERVCQEVSISVVAVSLKKKK